MNTHLALLSLSPTENARRSQELAESAAPRSHREAGMTLVEIITAVAMAAMVLVVVIPNLTYQRAKYRTIEAISELQQIHTRARFEALHRHRQTWLVIEEDSVTATLWGDSTAFPNGVLEVGVDEILDRYRVPDWLEFRRTGRGKAVDYFGPDYDTIEYRPDGSIVAGGATTVPALYFADRNGNALRLRINTVTGSSSVEMPIDGGWTGQTERWTWEF